jgi:NDP-sugar pyrophosphorylase family protein
LESKIDTAVILAGGLGKRLRPFSFVIPKPLMPVGEVALIEKQIEQLRIAGIRRVFIATNYKSDFLERFLNSRESDGMDIVFSKETKELGTAGPLSLIRKELTKPFLVMNGDILTLETFTDVFDQHFSEKAKMTVCIKDHLTPFNFGNVEIENDLIVRIEEKPSITMKIVAGIYVLSPEILVHIPEDTKYGMDELILKMLSRNMPIQAYYLKNYWVDVGRFESLSEAQELSEFQN